MSSELLNKAVVVDDDASVRRLIATYLKSSGYRIWEADSGKQAIELVKREAPSFVITDWEMPGMNGLELCHRVRQLDAQNYTYVVFLTGRAGEHDLRVAMDAGADDFLVKPLRKEELLARLTAGARVVRLESHLLRLATEDTLTGLLVRRGFNGFLNKEWHRVRRGQLPLSAVLLDIDHFKRVNDTYGHPAGDAVIRTIAQLIRDSVRKSDVVCRYGGEEFCVLLPETDEEAAKIWADRLRKLIANTSIDVGSGTIQLTVSGGVAEMVDEMEDPSDLLDLSDHCLLAAKQLGRDQIVTFREMSDGNSADDFSGWYTADSLCARDVMRPIIDHLEPQWDLPRAADHLLKHAMSFAPVTSEEGEILGILSDRDLLAIASSRNAIGMTVAEGMRSNVITYDEGAPLANILRFITRASAQSVIITAEGKPTGFICRRALLSWLIEKEWDQTSENSASKNTLQAR